MTTREYWNGPHAEQAEPWREIEGPWQTEPDKVQWTDEETGLPCLAVRAMEGHWCGYVGVSAGHPAHGRKWGDLPFESAAVNYADACQDWPDVEYTVCHIPEPGESDDVWWFGFDCMHSYDLVPAMLALAKEMGLHKEPHQGVTYKQIGWVRGRCEDLAEELASWTDGVPNRDEPMGWLIEQLPPEAAAIMRAAIAEELAK